MKRFKIRVDPIWRPLLFFGGATQGNSFVEVGPESLYFNFGFIFHHKISRSDIKAVFARSWPIWYGIGWRSNLRGVVGLVGSYENVVEVRLKSRKRAWFLFPMDRIGVSLEDPEGFVAAFPELNGKPAPAARKNAKPAPKARKPREPRATAARPKRPRRVSR